MAPRSGLLIHSLNLLVHFLCLTLLTRGVPNIAQDQWSALNASVDGRLFVGIPFSRPCFVDVDDNVLGAMDDAQCKAVMQGYTNTNTRINSFSAYMNTQWETCQLTSDQCLLDALDVADPAAYAPPQLCAQGSVSDFYIDVRQPSDVQAAFQFSASTGVLIVIKNTGHDYKGRSSAPGSLGLWTHNLQELSYNPSFIAAGCAASSATPGLTIGAGVTQGQVYDFADSHNILVPGGAERTVGAVGGYLQGGGHSAFSNAYGLAVDNVLEFKVVTPRGDYLSANACQNTDLFFALRGGGGGTFGVVMEATMRARPAQTFPVIVIQLPGLTADVNEQWVKLVVQSALPLASTGWGGYISIDENAPGMIFTNPLLSLGDAMGEMQALASFAESVGGNLSAFLIPTFGTFINTFLGSINSVVPVGRPFTVASRLIPAASFNGTDNQEELTMLLIAAHQSSVTKVLFAVAPFLHADDGQTSVTPAWRDALWHVVISQEWEFDTTFEEKVEKVDQLSGQLGPLRGFTLGGGAYQNEADVHEPNFSEAFWGSNYARLVSIKRKYDPLQLLDCWHCVDFGGPAGDRFQCYIR